MGSSWSLTEWHMLGIYQQLWIHGHFGSPWLRISISPKPWCDKAVWAKTPMFESLSLYLVGGIPL